MVYGHAISSSYVDSIECQIRICNVTSIERSFDLVVELRDSLNDPILSREYRPAPKVAEYSRGYYITDSLDLPPTGALDPGVYTLRFRLEENGIITDRKAIEFRIE